MNFKIGDIVAVLDDVIKGKIVLIQPDKISIENEDGFLFDFKPKELVLIKENQSELSKFSDIANEALMEKIRDNFDKKRKPIPKASIKNSLMEVDLHIHQLMASSKGMDNFDMLNLQISTAKQKLEFAIKNRIQRIIFIHGVGDGVLKSELEFLLKNYNVDYYAASFQKYGMGAMEVFIYQNSKG